jgi:hypothetical protein
MSTEKKDLPVYEAIFIKDKSEVKSIGFTDKPLFGEFIIINLNK